MEFCDVLEEAKSLLDTWYPVIELLCPGFKAPTIDAVVDESADGTRKAYSFGEAHINVRFRARARANDSDSYTQAQLLVLGVRYCVKC